MIWNREREQEIQTRTRLPKCSGFRHIGPSTSEHQSQLDSRRNRHTAHTCMRFARACTRAQKANCCSHVRSLQPYVLMSGFNFAMLSRAPGDNPFATTSHATVPCIVMAIACSPIHDANILRWGTNYHTHSTALQWPHPPLHCQTNPQNDCIPASLETQETRRLPYERNSTPSTLCYYWDASGRRRNLSQL